MRLVVFGVFNARLNSVKQEACERKGMVNKRHASSLEPQRKGMVMPGASRRGMTRHGHAWSLEKREELHA